MFNVKTLTKFLTDKQIKSEFFSGSYHPSKNRKIKLFSFFQEPDPKGSIKIISLIKKHLHKSIPQPSASQADIPPLSLYHYILYSTSLHKPRELLTSCVSGLQPRELLTSCVSGLQAAWAAHKLRERLRSCVSGSEAAWVAHKLLEWLTSYVSGSQAAWVSHKLREWLKAAWVAHKLREWLTSCRLKEYHLLYVCLCVCVL